MKHKTSECWVGTPARRPSLWTWRAITMSISSSCTHTKATRGGSAKAALMEASERGHVEVVQALLAAGADVNTQNQMRLTALMAAAAAGHLRIVRSLLEADADMLLRDITGNDALGWAMAHDHDDLGDMLREEADAARAARALERHMQRVRSLLEPQARLLRPPATSE